MREERLGNDSLVDSYLQMNEAKESNYDKIIKNISKIKSKDLPKELKSDYRKIKKGMPSLSNSENAIIVFHSNDSGSGVGMKRKNELNTFNPDVFVKKYKMVVESKDESLIEELDQAKLRKSIDNIQKSVEFLIKNTTGGMTAFTVVSGLIRALEDAMIASKVDETTKKEIRTELQRKANWLKNPTVPKR